MARQTSSGGRGLDIVQGQARQGEAMGRGGELTRRRERQTKLSPEDQSSCHGSRAGWSWLVRRLPWGRKEKEGWEFASSSFSSSPDLLHYDDLPDWAKDNDKIRTGYRPVRACHRHCFDSLFYLHNETSNIYSHGLPFLLGWGSAFYSLFIHLPAIHASVVDTLAFLPLILGRCLRAYQAGSWEWMIVRGDA